MPKKKKLFPFRIPWFKSTSASRPGTRKKDESKLQEQADTSIPIQGSPKKAPERSPTQDQEIPIADPQQHSPSHPLPSKKPFSVTNGSSGPSQSTSELLASMSSSPTSQPQSPAHLALEQTSEESRPSAIESTSLATSPSQQEKETMVVSDQESQPEMSPSKTIPKSQELTQPKISPPVSEPSPESQHLTKPETSSHVSEPMPQPKDSSLKSITDSQELIQQETSSLVSEPEPQSKKSPLAPIIKSQELTQSETPSLVSEPVPQLKESPLKASPKFKEQTQLEIPSHESMLEPEVKESPLKTSPKYKEVLPSDTTSHVSETMPQPKVSPLKIISEPQEPIQPKTASQPERMSSKVTEMLSNEEGSTTPKPPPADKKFEFDSNKGDSKTVLEIKSKFEENGENEKVVHETKAKLHSKASTSGTQTTDPSNRVTRSEREKQDTRESRESKVMSASNSTGKDIEVVSSILPMPKVSSPCYEKHVLPIEEKTPLKKGIKKDISKFVQKLAIGQSVDPMEDRPVSAITLVGENRGATIHMGSKSSKEDLDRAYRTSLQESSEVTTESNREEGSTNSVEPDEVRNSYVNSNIQSINNSLMYHGSLTEKDPGVQLIVPQKVTGDIKSDDDEDSKG